MRLRGISLSMRITFWALLLVVAGGVLWINKENARLNELYLRERSSDLEVALQVEQARLTQSIETLRQDVLFLANTPPVFGLVRAAANHGMDPRDRNPYATWESRLQEIFAAYLRAHPDYFHASLVGMADGGKELVRVEDHDGRIDTVPHDMLQAVGDQSHFQAGLQLTVGRVHLSEFTFEQGSGGAGKPALRAVTPVFDASGHVFGMVVIEKDVRPLFAMSAMALPPAVQGYITDHHGNYLFRLNGQAATGQSNIIDAFPSLKVLFDVQTRQNDLPMHVVNEPEGGYLAAKRVFFDTSDPTRFLLLVYHIPAALAATQISAGVPLPSLAETLLVMLLVSGVFMLMLRHTFSPLRRITAAARRIAAGEQQAHLQEKGGGEIGELVEALNGMLGKLSDREVIEKESAFRKELIESLPGVFYMIDVQGRFLMWNRNLELVLQRSGEEIAASHPLDFFEGGDKADIDHAMRRVFEQGEASVEAELVARDGRRTPYHFTGRRVMRAGQPVLIGMGLDISELRDSMRATEALLQRNQALMQSSMEGIHVMDVDGNVLEANDAFCRMLGYTRDEVMQLNVRDWDGQFSAEELRFRFIGHIGKSTMFETVHRRKDGSTLDVEICANGVEIGGKGYLFASSRDITERKRAQDVLRRHHQVIETAMDGFWMADAQGFLEEVNEAYAKMSGYAMQELVGMHISEVEASEQPDDVRAHIEKIMAQGYDRFETQHRRKDGRVIDIEVAATYMPESQKFFVFCHNITRRKHVEQALRVAAATFETHDAILITDAASNIIRVNHAFTEITGYTPEEVLGKNPRMMSSGRHDQTFYIKMWQQLLHTGSWAGEIWDRRKNGEIYPKWLSITAVKNERQEVAQYVAIFSDITERKRIEEEIRNMAFYDPLTQLPNRRLLTERVRAALTASARRRDHGAVLFLDMDKFKVLNDTLGHDCGDLMLIEVANRIKSCVRDMDTVARLGGDEFVVLLEGLDGEEQVAARKVVAVAEKIREALTRPYRIKEHEHHSSPSIGITLYRGTEQPVDVLLRRADLAMYQAKNGGRNTVCFFDPLLQDDAERHDSLEEDLRHAVERDELRLHYQVQVDGERRAIGAEALLRWAHPQRGLLLPEQFIAIAEGSVLIAEIGNWVLDETCAQLARWRDDGRMAQLTLTVNVSTRHFARHDFVTQVADVIGRHRVDPSRLKLELTQGVMASDLSGAVAKVRALRGLGISLSMDDFGTVYSSLYYLKQISSQQLKIRRDVVQGMTAEHRDAQLVRAIADLARNMELDVFAEGVETEAQFALLKRHDCKGYQGHLFGGELPVAELEALIRGQA